MNQNQLSFVAGVDACIAELTTVLDATYNRVAREALIDLRTRLLKLKEVSE